MYLQKDGQYLIGAFCSWCNELVLTRLDMQPGFELLGLCFESLDHTDPATMQRCRNVGMPRGVRFTRMHLAQIRRARRLQHERSVRGHDAGEVPSEAD